MACTICNALQSAFEDRGQSPERLRVVADNKKKGVDITVPAAKKGYVPPGQRGADGSRQKVIEGFDADEAASRIRNIAARKQVQCRTPAFHR